eukprot:TRINITY_DN71429_c0_g1_i1.p1 TRINITY_DN71429_c0_g1~~TRINITY_DN71429_c0_g1_i1.p1  ORF type:complete len:721 (+),score=196.43 TRINITY_DN71429_c0_g1_i1:104-2266(+)
MAEPGIEYSAQDALEALARFAAAAEGRPALEGGPSLTVPAEELQAMAQAVFSEAGPGGDGELSHAGQQHLQAIYKCIAHVINGSGAIDSFDIYEVCFETMTKMGFYLKSSASKELLSHMLEDVHEVYDVLLSCVETYEWVQPGATGLLRLYMLMVILSCFGCTSITGGHLMELTNNDVSGAVCLIAFILQCQEAPFEVQASAGSCLVELTGADSVFLSKNEEGALDDTQNQQIAKLTSMLNRHVNGLIKSIIQFDVVEAFGRCICQHQMSHARTDIIVQSFLTTIHNCLLYCSENQKKLRQHLATQSTIVRDIIIPYIDNILPALYDNPTCGPHCIEWRNLKAAMQTLVVVTFNVNVFRPQIRDGDALSRICMVPGILSHISMLELLIKIAINVDYVKGPPGIADGITNILSGAFAQLSPDSQARLQRRLTSERSMRLPYSRSCAKSVEALAFAVQQVEQAPAAPAPAVAAPIAGSKPKQPFAMQQAQKAPAMLAAPDESDDDMPPLIPADHWEPHLGACDATTGVPQHATCALSGVLMVDPVATPNGHVFERKELEDWMENYSSDPFSGQAMSMADCQEATQVKDNIRNYQMQALSSIAVTQPQAAAPAAPAAPSLLGDLPTLQSAPEAPKKPKKGKIRIESRSVVDCPPDMCCAIDGKVMTNPLRSPMGHHFEKKTLEKWVANCGSVCPITGNTLRLADCAPDPEMKKRIVQFLKGQQ